MRIIDNFWSAKSKNPQLKSVVFSIIKIIFIFIRIIIFLIVGFLWKKKKKILPALVALSRPSLILWTILDCPKLYLNLNWFYSSLRIFTVSFLIDTPFILFRIIALFVIWAIAEFSLFYMEKDPKVQTFLNLLILFLFFMLILISSNKFFILFIGWEGVGILSFILISWWFTRANANSAALQAIIYNRIGDKGFIFFIITRIVFFKSWKLSDIIFLRYYSPIKQRILIGIIIAAMGKSAQFSLHPWLPSAMEGPTPVSALLHRSTMVVAGVFLLYRCSPLLYKSKLICSTLGLIGALTTIFGARAALAQYDLKKVIAYSTTSQLGLMIISIRLGHPKLALFHICTHAFFKSLLFLCSGRLIHRLKKEQDFRKIKRLMLPFTKSCIIIGRIALSGFPFLAGYYSKDIILEIAQFNKIKFLIIILSLIATLMTSIYRLRIIYFLSSKYLKLNPINPIKENHPNLYLPFIRLIVGSLIAGWFLSIIIFDLSPPIMPILKKRIPLISSIYALIFTFNILTTNTYITFKSLIKFLTKKWFFVKITHGPVIKNLFIISLYGILRILDQGWTTYISAWGLTNKIKNFTKWAQRIQKGNLIRYITKILIILTAIILIII